jgi:hypothetical protein
MATSFSTDDLLRSVANYPVSKGGPGSGRHPEAISPEVADFITTNANKFYAAGGKIIKLKSGATTLPNGKTLKDARLDLLNKIGSVGGEKSEGCQMIRRNLAMLGREKGREAYVALDRNGNVVGVIGAVQHRQGRDWRITELGSTGEVPGTATALEHYIARVAGNTNVVSSATNDAYGYHRAIGRTLTPSYHPISGDPTDFTSSWSLEQMQAIAKLPIGPEYV